MREVGVLEAKTKLSALLAEVNATGAPIAITRHGKRVGRLSPDSSAHDDADRERRRQVMTSILLWSDEMAQKHPALSEPFDLRATRDTLLG